MHPVSALPADDARCGWHHTSRPRVPQPAHQGNSSVRFAVVGAGYTGLAAARQLALHYPNDEIALLEAQEVGFGTAGRNAGFGIDLPHDIGAKDYIGDLDTARNVLKLNRFGQTLLRDAVHTHRIDCSWQECGKYQAAVEPRGIAMLKAYQNGLEKLGEASEMMTAKDLPAHLGTHFYQQALFTPGTFLMQPAALVKGLADSLPANVTLYEKTPITALEAGDKIHLIHQRGRLTAHTVVMSNNIHGMAFGFLSKHMVPIFLYASLSRVLTENEQKALGGKDFWGVIPADPYGSTVRRTPDQRILIRNSASFGPTLQPSTTHLKRFVKRHQFSFRQRFPMLPNVDFEYSWSGCLALAHNGKDFWGKLAPNIYGSLCCNGLGVSRGTARGALLADWIAQKTEHHDLVDVLLSSKRPNRLPPEPFLSLGVNATLSIGHYRAGLER